MNSIVRYIKPWFESVITNISVTCMRDYGTAESMPHASLYDTLNRIGWNKFRQLVPLLTNKDVSLIMRGRLCSSCMRSSMLHGSVACCL